MTDQPTTRRLADHYRSPPPHDGCPCCDALSIVLFTELWLKHTRRPFPRAADRRMRVDNKARLVIGELTVDPVGDGLIVVAERGSKVFAFDAGRIHRFEPGEWVDTLATVHADLHVRYGFSAYAHRWLN